MSIFAELRRRNVFRVAAYYVGVGWLLIQVTDVLTSILELPDWTGRLVFALLLIGLPVALLLAWAFELTPDGVRRESTSTEHAASTAGRVGKRDYVFGAVIAIAISWYAWDRMAEPEPETLADAPIRSVVVLPFKNLMHDPDQDFFVEGMHDALITQLSKVSSLHIISQTTAMHYAGSDKPLREIARELNVDAAVEGSVLRAGDIVRVTTQLIDARNDRHIWADNFDRKLVDILALYNEVTQEITYQVQVSVTPEEKARLATRKRINPDAYDLYLKGRHLCENWSPQEMREGAALLEEAIETDPGYAAPYAQLSMCLVDSAFFEYVRPDDIDSAARTAALTAVELDDQLAEAHVALGSVRYYLDFDPAPAEAEYLRALELNGNSVDTLLRLSWFYAEGGQFSMALKATLHALELDPLSTAVRNALGQTYYLNRDIGLAIEKFGDALDLDRSDPSLNNYLGLAQLQAGEFDEATRLIEAAVSLSDGAPLYLSSLGYAYAKAGRKDEAQDMLARLTQTGSPSPYNLAIIHLGLGEHEQALNLLEQAVERGDFQALYLKTDPRFDPLRGEPRFASMVTRIGW